MKIKQTDAEYTYDFELDIVNIKVKENYNYKESIDFETGVFLDFDENNYPVNLEILSISKRLGVDKDYLLNPRGAVNISIIGDTIRLDVYFKNNGDEHVLHYVNVHEENLNINNIETKFAIV